MKLALPHTMAVTPGGNDWMQNRLSEARDILVDAPRHPNSLVILACRVIAGQTDSASECADAIDLLRQLHRRPLHTVAAAAFPNGGAA